MKLVNFGKNNIRDHSYSTSSKPFVEIGLMHVKIVMVFKLLTLQALHELHVFLFISITLISIFRLRFLEITIGRTGSIV